MLTPLYLPRYHSAGKEKATILAVDLGGTKTAVGLFSMGGKNLKLLEEAAYPSAEYSSFVDIFHQFLQEKGLAIPDRISIGVAGPVMNGTVQLTNLAWGLDRQEILKDTGVKEVSLINDLEATSFGLAGLTEDYLATTHTGKPQPGGNMAILAPGTGLGEAGLFWDGSAYRPFATEGGHCNYAPLNDLDIELYHHIQEKHPIVSWEHLISGRGIFRIYRFLRDVKGYKEPGWLTEKLAEDDPAAVISHTAMRELNEACTKTMEMFVSYMAEEAANLVLKLKATGGLFLGGGIPPKIFPLLKTDAFYKHFINSHQMQNLLREIPIKVILNSKSALLGAAYYGAYGPED